MSVIVELQDQAHWPNTPDLSQFKQWIKASLVQQSAASEITIRLVTLDESAHLNKTYRKKDGPTNVLSFNYEPLPGVDEPYLGDLAICAELVSREAKTQHKSLLAHWAHLTVHGSLHLQGYDHINEQEAEEMEQREIKILAQLGFSNPYNDEKQAHE